MKSKLVSFLLVLLLCAPALPQELVPSNDTIASIRIEGNRRIATETYLYYVSSKVGSPLNEATLRDDFRRLWQTGFLNNLTIETEQSPEGLVVTFKVEERPLIRSIEYTGNKKISTGDIETKLKDENISLKTEQPFDPQVAQKVVNSVNKLMQEKGLQFGNTTYKTEPLGDTGTKLTFVVDEGPKVKIGEIEFEGNEVFSDGKLKKTMKDTREHWMFSWITRRDDFEKEKFDKDIERVNELYFNHGYINARIEEPIIELLPNKERMKITIPVKEGQQFKTGDVTFAGNTVFTEQQLKPLVPLQKGKVFNRSVLRKAMEEIQKEYGDRGYIYASLAPVFDVKEETKSVDLKIEVQENGQFYVNRIEFTGNTYTRDKVVRRELLLQEGELLRVNKFRDSLDRIYRLGYFEDIKPNITPTTDEKNRADITIDVKENKRNEIRLGGGYSELEGFFGDLVFSTKNLFGTGKVFTVNIQSGSRTKNYGLEILEPYFLDRRIGIGVSAFQTRYDFFSFFRQTTGGAISVGFPLFEEFKGAVSYGYQVVDVDINQEEVLNPFADDVDRSESRVVPQLLRSTINNPLDPSRGTRLIFANEIVGGPLGGDLNYYKPSISYTFYLPGVSRSHFSAFNVEAGYATGFGGIGLPFFERFFLGGEQTIRGYDLRSVGPINVRVSPTSIDYFPVGGNKYFLINSEYVIPLAGPLKIAGFLDYGNAFAKGQNFDFTDMRGSAGLELRFLAPFLSAPFRFIYAFNFNRGNLVLLPEGQRPERTVFRFSVGTTF